MKIDDVKAYEIIKKKDVKDLNSAGYLLRHKKTGARVFILSNDDRNKVFYIGFRTPPEDSCGTTHILEHTVLCGSSKYKAKDPFIELAKGSLNTFLNAMTYPDKTVFPVASVNDKDFKNLSDVYMDAVFHPNIYENEKIFLQEGWHYELDSPEDGLRYNGVVYNEMKGAYSSPDDVLDSFTYRSLYPDTPYALESGGDPEAIPDLTYEKFLNLHRKYYHPSNAYIYIYGDADMAERLMWMDREYLSKYDRKVINSEIQVQKPFSKMKAVKKTYSVADGEPIKNNTYLSYNCVVGNNLDKKLYVAFEVLQYALLDSPGAPLKQALLDAGIGKDIEGTYENGIYQPYFAVIAKYADEADKDKFVNVIKSTLKKIAAEGMDKKSLLAGINYFEFRYREADFGQYPKGLMYGLQSLDSWLYDENDPFMHIEQNTTYEYLRREAEKDGTGIFEELITRYLVENTHSAIVVLCPEKGLTAKRDEITAGKLADYKKSLSDEEIADIIRNTQELKAYQEEPSTQEMLRTIPLLEISDIDRKALEFKNDKHIVGDTIYLHHDIFTNKIIYLGLMFSLQSVPVKLVPYIGLLKNVLGNVSTAEHSYQELNNEINLYTGGISFEAVAYPDTANTGDFDEEFEIRAKMLEERVDNAYSLINEMLFTSDFSDRKRMLEIIRMIKSRMQSSMVAQGHTTAAMRAMSYISDMSYYSDLVNGIGFYRFIDGLEKNFDDKKADEVNSNLKILMSLILHRDNLMVDITGSQAALKSIYPRTHKLKEKLSAEVSVPAEFDIKPDKLNEGFRTASQVQFVAKVGNFIKQGHKYTGALRVLKIIMGYDYLWNNIRVLGGAYGCMSLFMRTGEAYLVTYRDPHINNSIKVFDASAAYVKKFDVDRRDMTKFIIGTVSDMDTPLNPKAEGLRSLSAFMGNIDQNDVQKERDEVINCTAKDIRALAPYLEDIMKENNLCVVGSEEKINDNKKLFKKVINLL